LLGLHHWVPEVDISIGFEGYSKLRDVPNIRVLLSHTDHDAIIPMTTNNRTNDTLAGGQNLYIKELTGKQHEGRRRLGKYYY
jgi:hypothetical protein